MTERTLGMALECLEPVRERLVVVGGTAHRLFPRHELGRDPGFELLTTEDVDIAAPLELGHDGGRDLMDRLEKAGFESKVHGAETPTHIYRLPDDGHSYLQFIAPLTGSGVKRDGTKDDVLRFSGIHAEKLRHVDLLLHRPWKAVVGLDRVERTLLVVNPVAYLLQKLLVLPSRRNKRGKDLLYLFDTLAIFGSSLDALRADSAQLAPQLSKASAMQIARTAADLCFRENDVSREAARIASAQRTRAPDSRQIVTACELGLRRVLGGTVSGL